MPQEAAATEWLANLSIGAIVVAAFVLTVVRVVLVASARPQMRWLAELIESVVIAGVMVFLLIRPFGAQAFYIPSESMEPTLLGHDAGLSRTGIFYPDTQHDHLFVNKLAYRFHEPARGDIVVFRAPRAADYEGGFRHETP